MILLPGDYLYYLTEHDGLIVARVERDEYGLYLKHKHGPWKIKYACIRTFMRYFPKAKKLSREMLLDMHELVNELSCPTLSAILQEIESYLF